MTSIPIAWLVGIEQDSVQDAELEPRRRIRGCNTKSKEAVNLSRSLSPQRKSERATSPTPSSTTSSGTTSSISSFGITQDFAQELNDMAWNIFFCGDNSKQTSADNTDFQFNNQDECGFEVKHEDSLQRNYGMNRV